MIDRAFEFFAFHHQQQLSREAWFLLWTLKGFLIYEGFYFVLPFALNLPQDLAEKPFFMTKFDRLEPRSSKTSNAKRDQEEAESSSDFCEIVTPYKVTTESEPDEEDTPSEWSVDNSIFDCWTDFSTEEEARRNRTLTEYRTRCWVEGTANEECRGTSSVNAVDNSANEECQEQTR